MTFKKTFVLVIIISCCSATGFAQLILYSQLFDHKHAAFYYIAGKVGNNYHIWKTTQSGIRVGKEKIAIDIIILSDQMKVIDEKALMIDESNAHAVKINFTPIGTYYFATIDFYDSGVLIKQQVLKMDENGSIIDSAIHPGSFTNKTVAGNYTSFDSAVIGRANWTYTVTTRPVNQDGDLEETQSVFHKLLDIDQTEMIIRKQHYPRDTIAPMVIRYRSSKFNYHFPKIIPDSNGIVWVCASQKRTAEAKDSSNAIFLVKLDSNLNELPGAVKYIKSNLPDATVKALFNPQEIFMVNRQLFLISVGAFPETFYYSKSAGVYRGSYDIYQTRLLRVTQLDESMNLLHDTLISLLSMGSEIFPYGAFYSTQDGSIDMFCNQQFPHKMNGIKWFRISKNPIEESNLLVDPHNEYLISGTIRIDKDIYIIPFSHNGKIGFMKWANSN